MERKDIIVGGRTVRYYEAGEGPALVLLHGAGATGRLWHRQFGPLSENFWVIAPDLPGFGGSARFPDIRDVRGYEKFLSLFLDSLGIRRIFLAGSSMGGWVACWFAVDYPEKLRKLVLVSPAGVYHEEEPPMSVDRVIKELERYYSNIPSPLVQGFDAVDELTKGVETILSIHSAGGFRTDVEERLSDIKATSLIIWGREDRVVPVSYAKVFHERIRGSKLLVLEGVGHLPYIERPEEFNSAVNDFLAS
ncbi:MAG: alpha/beta hydrolase [Nitrospirota bacterium]